MAKGSVKRRQIILRIDDVVALFRDYLSAEDIPGDIQALKLMVNPATREVAILAQSEAWTSSAPLRINFTHRRLHAL